MEARVRRFLGFSERHTGQSQPITGTPLDVPHPRMVIFIGSGRKLLPAVPGVELELDRADLEDVSVGDFPLVHLDAVHVGSVGGSQVTNVYVVPGERLDDRVFLGNLLVVEDQVGDWEQYGMKDPRLRVLLKRGQETQLEVRLGAEREGGIFCSKAGEASVYLVDAELLSELDLGLDDVAQPLPDASAPEDSAESGTGSP